MFYRTIPNFIFLEMIFLSGWLGRAMVLGSFQCRVASSAGPFYYCGIMVWQGPAVLAAGAGRVGCFFFFCFFFVFGFCLFVFHLVYPIFLF